MNGLRYTGPLDDRLVAADLARDRRWTLLALVFAVAALALVLFDCGNVEDAYANDATPQLVLARAIAGEAGFDASPDEAAAIGYVLGRRGTRYSAAVRTCRRPWVCGLSADGSEPAGWPASWSWERSRPLWLRLYERTGRIMRGEVARRCSPDHFGSAEDASRAWRAGWRPVFCGRTRNWFWAVAR